MGVGGGGVGGGEGEFLGEECNGYFLLTNITYSSTPIRLNPTFIVGWKWGELFQPEGGWREITNKVLITAGPMFVTSPKLKR